jgi:acetoin utilization deacetylase AcuC-like enzyme
VPRLRYVALHGDPSEAFPYFSGFADEAGADAGEGYNINFPLPRATGFGLWQQTLATALACIRRYSPDALVVSLGVDTFVRDPISFFRLESSDFSTYGGMIGACRIPTLFVFEGGYAVADVGVNVVNVLAGFEDV